MCNLAKQIVWQITLYTYVFNQKYSFCQTSDTTIFLHNLKVGMTPFLYRIAKTFYTEYQGDITDFTFVFPNRRAGLFFQKYLSEIIETPVFSPEIFTVNELFKSATTWDVVDKTELLFRLYAIFRQISKREETFDTFVGWGEMLITDFDEVDRYLVDAEQLFTNVTELKEIDTVFNFFSESQAQALEQFWKHFLPITEKKTQGDFIAVWRILLPIYQQLRAELLEQNLATDAMICRDVVTKLEKNELISVFANRQFVFVGFNALNPSEHKLFEQLQKRNQADFYWDYESDELRDEDNLSSAFFYKNTQQFPSKLPVAISDNPLKNKSFELISIPSAVGQTKETYRLLNELHQADEKQNNWIKTAVVLPDENLLLPLLHSLPEQIEKVNVTMGFPLKSTPVVGLMEHIFDLQKRGRKTENGASFYHQTVLSILHHPYIQFVSKVDAELISEQIIRENKIYPDQSLFASNEILSTIFQACSKTEQMIDYLLGILKKLYTEMKNLSSDADNFDAEYDFLYQYYVTLNRLNDVINHTAEIADFSIDTLVRMVRQFTAGLIIPYEGEPLEGLQIMGTLETRGLDFENLIICSFNEGTFPKKSMKNSFIPYNLRKAFELPTAENQDIISSYNFYRLIQRARKIYFLYDSRSEGGQTGEVSRFVYQLKYHYGINFKEKNITYDIHFPDSKSISIEKTTDVLAKLDRFLDTHPEGKALSASSLNNYIDCPLKFYFSQVEKVEQPDEIEENIEANMFGTLLHEVMENIYKPYKGKLVQTADLDEILKNPIYIDQLIRRSFAKNYFQKKDENITLEGNYLLVGKVIEKYIRQILTYDKTQTPFTYIDSEMTDHYIQPIFNSERSVRLKGIIDRVEMKEGVVRVIDYKTGYGDLKFKDLDEVFEHNNDKRPKYILQTFLYSLLYRKYAENETIIPLIYYIKNIFKSDFDTELTQKPEKNAPLRVEDFGIYEEDFKAKLKTLLEEIYNPAIPFVQCEQTTPCAYCPFNEICRRN